MWVKVRIKGTGQVQEMVPAVAAELIANGIAEKYTEGGNPSHAVETAALKPEQETAVSVPAGSVQFKLGPRTMAVRRAF